MYEPLLYEEYLAKEKEEYIQNLKNGKVFAKKPSHCSQKSDNCSQLKNEHDLILYKLNPKFFLPAEEIPEALEYCRKRKIPDEIIKQLKYFTMGDKGKHILEGMLIFPCYYDSDRVYAFQGRSIATKMFYNHFPNESFKIHNIFGVDLTKDVYIFESIIDSYCMPNSVAMLGTSLSDQVKLMIPKKIYVLDNDSAKRGKRDRKGWEKSLEYAYEGEKVVIYPNEIKFKDANDMLVKNKLPLKTIQDIIKNNVFSGMKAVAKLRFKLSQKR
jgi:hypothetical protein